MRQNTNITLLKLSQSLTQLRSCIIYYHLMLYSLGYVKVPLQHIWAQI